MKFGIFFCILVVLAVHEAVSDSRRAKASFPAWLEGNCQPEDLPRDDLHSCLSIKCEKKATGAISVIKLGCSLFRCPNGKEIGHGPYDLTKPYPECCNVEKCD